MQQMGCGTVQPLIETRGPLYIYYGTTSGNSSRIAYEFADQAKKHKFIPKIINLGEFDAEQLKSQRFNVFFVSTYGSGGPTADALDFNEWLMSEERTKDSLKNIFYTVFALGSTDHQHFCGMGIKVDERLAFMGAERIFSLGKGNSAQETTVNDYEEWVKGGVFSALEKCAPIQQCQELESTYKVQETKKEEVEKCENLCYPAQKLVNAVNLQILDIYEMKKQPSFGNSTLFIDFQSDLAYKTAQNIAIYPENTDQAIQELCQQILLNPKLKFEIITKSKQPFPNPISVENYLKRYCDFLGPVSKRVLYELSHIVENQQDKEHLLKASSHAGRELFEAEFSKECFLSLIKKYHITKIKLEELIELCPLISPRFFTIASSPLKRPNNIQICCSELIFNERLGLCSAYLKTLQKGMTVKTFLQDSEFKFPKDPQAPILLLSIGAGISPMRSFIEEKDEYIERDKLDESPFKGPLKMFFGCRTQNDYLFQKEMIEYEQNGTLSELKVAFSREGEKIHITKLLSLEFLQQHIDMGGIIYMCGSVKMGKDISVCIENMFKQIKKVMPYLAYKKVLELEQNGQIIKELWG